MQRGRWRWIWVLGKCCCDDAVGRTLSFFLSVFPPLLLSLFSLNFLFLHDGAGFLALIFPAGVTCLLASGGISPLILFSHPSLTGLLILSRDLRRFFTLLHAFTFCPASLLTRLAPSISLRGYFPVAPPLIPLSIKNSRGCVGSAHSALPPNVHLFSSLFCFVKEET